MYRTLLGAVRKNRRKGRSVEERDRNSFLPLFIFAKTIAATVTLMARMTANGPKIARAQKLLSSNHSKCSPDLVIVVALTQNSEIVLLARKNLVTFLAWAWEMPTPTSVETSIRLRLSPNKTVFSKWPFLFFKFAKNIDGVRRFFASFDESFLSVPLLSILPAPMSYSS